ncbi:hypothetical protein C8R44DRAFT_100121 [Mycena epipterygia]|nr:hypothetical protein C8R44DRAFT_100121 [Mycena epipterygia]
MPPSKSSLLPLLVILTVISTALNVGLLRRVLLVSHDLSGLGRHNFEYSYEPREIPASIRPAAMVFEAPDSQYPLDDDRIWASIVPPKRGFLRLGPDGTPFSLALYHQLHCVNGIRFAYVASRDGLFKTEKMRAESFGHVNHCFDVLRQSLMCKADTTLVPVGASNETSVTRRCRDWTQVRDFVGSNHEFWRDVPYTPPPEATQTRPKSW